MIWLKQIIGTTSHQVKRKISRFCELFPVAPDTSRRQGRWDVRAIRCLLLPEYSKPTVRTILRQQFRKVVPTLRHTDAVAVEIVVEAKLGNVIVTAQPIKIKMIDRNRPLMAKVGLVATRWVPCGAGGVENISSVKQVLPPPKPPKIPRRRSAPSRAPSVQARR